MLHLSNGISPTMSIIYNTYGHIDFESHGFVQKHIHRKLMPYSLQHHIYSRVRLQIYSGHACLGHSRGKNICFVVRKLIIEGDRRKAYHMKNKDCCLPASIIREWFNIPLGPFTMNDKIGVLSFLFKTVVMARRKLFKCTLCLYFKLLNWSKHTEA